MKSVKIDDLIEHIDLLMKIRKSDNQDYMCGYRKGLNNVKDYLEVLKVHGEGSEKTICSEEQILKLELAIYKRLFREILKAMEGCKSESSENPE